MNHHRCSRCKEESYPRHKYRSGVYCDHCITIARFGQPKRRGGLFSLWDKFRDWVTHIFTAPTSARINKSRDRAVYAQQKTMEARARKIPKQTGLNMLMP